MSQPARETFKAFVAYCLSMQAEALDFSRARAQAFTTWDGGVHGAKAVRGRKTLVPQRSEADIAMERYAAGDDEAFGLVYDALAPRLYGYLVRQTRDRARAEDLLQQTLLHIHRSRDRFIPGAEVTPWAFAIARRLLVDRLRHREPGRRADPVGLDAQPSAAPTADDVLRASEVAGCLESALSQLPPPQREAFVLIKEEGLSICEAAKVLGTTVGAAKLRVHRAYEALRAAVADAETAPRRGTR